MTPDYPKPIAPPPELVTKWVKVWERQAREDDGCISEVVAIHAAQWGADQELEACLDFVQYEADWDTAERLRAARRPKPPSLKEQALKALGSEPLPETGPTGDTILNKGSIECHRCIRRALEQLDD
jgi:hypothetical protein